jgi:hypothetical protein
MPAAKEVRELQVNRRDFFAFCQGENIADVRVHDLSKPSLT